MSEYSILWNIPHIQYEKQHIWYDQSDQTDQSAWEYSKLGDFNTESHLIDQIDWF